MRLATTCLIITAASACAAVPGSVASFLQQHCTECHDSEVKKAGLDLTEAKWQLQDAANLDLWIKVHDRTAKGEMPPAKKPRPAVAELSAFTRSLDGSLHEASAAVQGKTGRTLARRLNRIEYEHTVQDLLGIDLPLAPLLPEDTPLHGFDTVAEGLRFSQLQIEKYLEAADSALDAALDLRVPVQVKLARYSYKDESSIKKNLELPDDPPTDPKKKYSRQRQQFRLLPDGVAMFSDPDYMLALNQFKKERSGHYRIRLSAYGYQSDGKPVTLRLYANNYQIGRRLLGSWDMPADRPREVEVTARIQQGEQLMVLPFSVGYDKDGKRLNDYDTTKEFLGRGLVVQWVETEGPLEGKEWPSPSALALLGSKATLQPLEEKNIRDKWNKERAIGYEVRSADPSAALQDIVQRFATRAFRRPLEQGEADRFTALAQNSLSAGGSFLEAVKVALRGVLTAPQFLLFDEAPGPLQDYALASRLSYFLWSTLPDAELMQLAAEKKLHEPSILRAQTERLLADKRSRNFVQNFTGQWLDLRSIDATSPDASLYPEFDELLKNAMVGETEAFFTEILQKNLPLSHFIHSDYLMLNSRIAQHYGIGTDVAKDETFVRVSLPPGSPRGGLLTQASVLKVTANGTVTSPVLRGAWVMKRLLGDPPPPPPPGISGVEPDTRGASTIREILAKHRDSETCASCHAKIDPPGFALESYDVIGGWRDRYRSKEKGDRPSARVENRGVWQYKVALPVDASGQFPDGTPFTDIHGFKQVLLQHPEPLHRCVAEKLLTYATGAAPSYADRRSIQALVPEKKPIGLKSLVIQLVLSDTFKSK